MKLLLSGAARACVSVFLYLACTNALAHRLQVATVEIDCSNEKISTNFLMTNIAQGSSWSIDYRVRLAPAVGPTLIFDRELNGLEDDDDMVENAMDMFSTGPLSGPYTVSGYAQLWAPAQGDPAENSWNRPMFTDPDGMETPFVINCDVAGLGDFVWEDLNGDGLQDANEPGVDGVVVDLYFCDNGVPGALADTQTTMNGGGYLFSDLTPGEYKVTFNAPTGFGFTGQDAGTDDAVDSDADGVTGMTQCITLAAGETNLDLDAGLIQPASLGDYVWEDADRDGLQGAIEPGINGVVVSLTDCSGNPVVDFSGNPVNSTVTANDGNSDGAYSLENLAPGCYLVEFSAPAGFSFTDPGDGSAPEDDSNANPGTGITGPVQLASGENDPTIDAGLFRNQGLGDFLFEDLNANGIQDPGEPGIEGVQVNLLEGDCMTPTGAFDVTDANGIYGFNDLVAGTYCVSFDLPDICDLGVGNASFTLQGRGSDTNLDSNVDGNGVSDPVTLQAGDLDLSIDAGVYCPAKIGDLVWNDSDNDGIQDNVPVDESSAAGVTVNLLDCDGNPVVDLDGFDSMVTDSTGMYMFRVMPGGYIVEFVAPNGQSFSPAGDGSNPALDSNANPVSGRSGCLDVPSDTYDDTIDAGLVPPQECALAVNKQCAIVAPEPTQPFSCDGKVDTLVMRYDGSLGALLNVQAFAGDENTAALPVSIDGNIVTVDGYVASGAPNDVVWLVEGANGSGMSTFHRSCSDDEMDGETDDPAFPNDCGRPEGNGKDNNSGENLWFLEGLGTDEGQTLQCVPPEPVLAESCSFQAGFASCDTLPNNPDVLTFRYTGGGCAASDNGQNSATCSGTIDGNQSATVSFGNQSFTVAPGETFAVDRGDASDIELSNTGGTEVLEIHTSCSQPLETDGVFGSLTLVALDGVGGGNDIAFSYAVMNNGSSVISDILVADSELGVIASGLSLDPGTGISLEATAYIDTTTTNTVDVTGTAGGASVCEASDSLTVTVLPPPPCEVSVAFDELKDDAIKYTLTNSGGRQATLDTLVFNFPAGYEAIGEVKLDGAIYKSGDSPLVVTSGVQIGSGDWTEANVEKRQLDSGEERTLEIKFEADQDKDLFENDIETFFSGAATFEEGCSINF